MATRKRQNRMIFRGFLLTIVFISSISSLAYAQSKMSLSDCISFGMSNSPHATIASNQVEIFKYNKRGLYSSYLPQINASGNFEYDIKQPTTIIPAADFGFGNLLPPGAIPGGLENKDLEVRMGQPYTNNASIQLTQKIYDQTAITGISGVKKYERLSQLQSQKTKVDLMYSIASAYYQVLTLNQQIDILKANKEQYEKLLEIMKLQLEKGVIKELDLNRVQVAFNNIQSQLNLLETTKEVSVNRLKVAMGMDLDNPLEINTNLEGLKGIEPPTDVQSDISNRLDYQINQVRIELEELNTDVTKFSFLPTLSGYFTYGANSYSDDFRGAWDKFYDFASVGLKLTIPIFNGLKVNTEYHKQLIELKNLKAQNELMESNFEVELMNSNATLKKAHANYLTNQQNLDLAEKVYSTTQLSYQKGAATLSDLLNAEYSYKEAQSNYFTSFINMLTSRLDYEKAKGNLSNYLLN